MRTISCRVKIDLTADICRNLNQYRYSNSKIKQRLLSIIYSLIKDKYRHFVIDIDNPADYWFAELVYVVALAEKSLNIHYSIGLRSEENETIYDWMYEEPLCKAILFSAYRVYYRKEEWYERKYELKTYALQ